MTELWPFVNPWPGGVGSTVAAADLGTLALQVEQAAWGALYTEYSVLSNLRTVAWPGEATNANYAAAFDTSSQNWYLFGKDSSGDPEGAKFSQFAVTGALNLTIPAEEGLTPKAAAHNGSGLVVLAGTPGGASANKYRRVAGSGTTFTTGVSTDSSAAGANCVVHQSGRFVSGLSNGVIETSADGTTWAVAPGAPTIATCTSMATSGSRILLAVAGERYCLVSDDGLSWDKVWLSGTCPDNAVWVGGDVQRFFLVDTGTAYVSSSGYSWSQRHVDAPSGVTKGVVALGRFMIARSDESAGFGLTVSHKAKAWRVAKRIAPLVFLATSATQLLAMDASEVIYLSFRTDV